MKHQILQGTPITGKHFYRYKCRDLSPATQSQGPEPSPTPAHPVQLPPTTSQMQRILTPTRAADPGSFQETPAGRHHQTSSASKILISRKIMK